MSDCKHEKFCRNIVGGHAFCANCNMDLDSVRCEEIDRLKQELEAAKATLQAYAKYDNAEAMERDIRLIGGDNSEALDK